MRRVARLAALLLLLVPCSGARAHLLFEGSPKWGSPTLGTGAVVTWSLIPDGTTVRRRPPFFPPEEPFLFHDFWQGNSNLSAIYTKLDPNPATGQARFLNALQGAFAAWAGAANLTFVQVPDSGLPLGSPGPYAGLVGDIRIGAWDLAAPFDAFAAQAFEPPGGTSPGANYLAMNSPSTFGDITLNTNAFFSTFPGLVEGDPYSGFPNDIQNLLTHEIGHALGLRHPADDGLDPGEEFAIMRNSAPLNIQRQLAADDVNGIRTLYGPARVAQQEVPEPATLLLAAAGLALLGLSGSGSRQTSDRTPTVAEVARLPTGRLP